MKIKISDYIAKFIEKKRIKHIFGVTGGGAMHLNDSFGKSKKIKFIFFHHEQAASMAAEAYFRVHNLPCLLHTTSGPGATNAITGVTGAWIDSIPMIVISGQVPKKDMINKSKTRQIGVQEINITDIVKPITKYSKVLTKPHEVDIVLNEAFEKMISDKPGPVWIDIPLDIQSSYVELKRIKKFKKKLKNKKIVKINYKKILDEVNKSKKPLIIIGNGIHLSNSTVEFKRFLKMLKIPVISSWNASDIISTSNNLYVGRMGIFGERTSNLAVESSDLLIILGTRLSIPQTGYVKKNFSPNSKKIFVDIDRNEMNAKEFSNFLLKLNIDLKYFLKGAITFIKNKKIKKFYSWTNLILDWKKKYSVVENKHSLDNKFINSFDFIDILSKNLKGNETIVTDMGTSFTCTMQSFNIKKPLKQRLFTSSGLASMGFGLPGIIGAYFADNKKKPICISGEGGLMFNLQELQTIKNYSIPLKLFIIENKGYLTMKLMQKKNFKRIVGADPKSGVTFPSFKKLADTFKFEYIKIQNNKILEHLKKVLKSKRPVIAEVNLHPYQELVPRIQNRLNKDGTFMVPKFDDLYPHLSEEKLNYERLRAKKIK
tara:strand:+ start:324 stop:2120 length:1797 start_codon:yes stop_codon:yes gene_type:complete